MFSTLLGPLPPDPDATDELKDDFLDNPGHGTGTGSVILSGVGGTTSAPGPWPA